MENFGVILVLVLSIITISVTLIFYSVTKRQRSSSVVILDKIREINEYASHELNYFETMSSEEALKLFKFSLSFMKRGYSATIIGKIKIGIHLENLKINITEKNIDITIPQIKIISHETKISEIGFQTKNPFFQNDINDFNQKLEEMKNEKEIAILQNDKLIMDSYEDLKRKITDSLLLIPNFRKKFNVNYIIEMPDLIIDDSQSL